MPRSLTELHCDDLGEEEQMKQGRGGWSARLGSQSDEANPRRTSSVLSSASLPMSNKFSPS